MKTAGYTLIEILIVLFIISIVTTVALLNISRNENNEMESFANELTQIVTLAEEQAMLNPNVLGLSFTDQRFQFASLQKNKWLPMEDNLLGKHEIPDNLYVTVKSDSNIKPQIIISTNGDITPFTIYVGKKGHAPRYAIIGDANGSVTHQLLS